MVTKLLIYFFFGIVSAGPGASEDKNLIRLGG